MSPERRRVVGTAVVAGAHSAAFLLAPALLPGSDLTPMVVTVGLLAPASVGGLFLLLMHRPIERADRRVSSAELRAMQEKKAGVR